MNYVEFKKILKKSSVKILVVGVVITLVGLPFLGANFYDESKTSYWIFGILFSAIGLLIVIKSILELGKIKSDTHPLLNAIVKGDKSYLIWVYQKQIISKVEGANVGKSTNMMLVSKENKLIEIVLNKSTSPSEFTQYVINQFPNALVGFSEENELKVKNLFKKQ